MVDVRRTPPRASAPPPPYRRSKGPLIALAILVIIGLAAVGVIVFNALDEPAKVELGTESGVPTAPAPNTPVDPEAATKAEIIDTHRQASEVFVALGSDPNGQFDDPRLARYKTGTALAAAQLAIQKYRADGDVLKVTQFELHPKVVKLGPDTAVVEDCAIDVSALVDQATGEVVIPAEPPRPELYVAQYELVGDVWMQSSFKAEERSCVPPGS